MKQNEINSLKYKPKIFEINNALIMPNTEMF